MHSFVVVVVTCGSMLDFLDTLSILKNTVGETQMKIIKLKYWIAAQKISC